MSLSHAICLVREHLRIPRQLLTQLFYFLGRELQFTSVFSSWEDVFVCIVYFGAENMPPPMEKSREFVSSVKWQTCYSLLCSVVLFV